MVNIGILIPQIVYNTLTRGLNLLSYKTKKNIKISIYGVKSIPIVYFIMFFGFTSWISLLKAVFKAICFQNPNGTHLKVITLTQRVFLFEPGGYGWRFLYLLKFISVLSIDSTVKVSLGRYWLNTHRQRSHGQALTLFQHWHCYFLYNW